MPIRTVRDLFDRAVALGLVTPERAAATPTYDLLDSPLDGRADEVVGWVVELGVGFTVHSEDIDDVAVAYEDTLQALAACTRGLFTITDVQLNGGELTFRRNGRLVTWRVDDFGEYLDHMPFFENLDSFEVPTSPLRWHELTERPVNDGDYYFFAEPVAMATFAREYGLGVTPLDTGLPPDEPDAPPTPTPPTAEAEPTAEAQPRGGRWRRLWRG